MVFYIAAAWTSGEGKGSPISAELASLSGNLLVATLDDKRSSVLSEKYPIPENSERLNAPKVNPEIWRVMESRTRSIAVKLQKLQQYVLRSVVLILQVIDTLIASRESHVSLNIEELITKL